MLSRILKPKNERIDPDRFRRAVDQAEMMTLYVTILAGVSALLHWITSERGDWGRLIVIALYVLVAQPVLIFALSLFVIVGVAADKGRPIIRPKLGPDDQKTSGPPSSGQGS